MLLMPEGWAFSIGVPEQQACQEGSKAKWKTKLKD